MAAISSGFSDADNVLSEFENVGISSFADYDNKWLTVGDKVRQGLGSKTDVFLKSLYAFKEDEEIAQQKERVLLDWHSLFKLRLVVDCLKGGVNQHCTMDEEIHGPKLRFGSVSDLCRLTGPDDWVWVVDFVCFF